MPKDEIQAELDPHFIPDLNNIVSSYIRPQLGIEEYIDGPALLETVLLKRKNAHEAKLEENIKDYKKIIEDAFRKKIQEMKKQVEKGEDLNPIISDDKDKNLCCNDYSYPFLNEYLWDSCLESLESVDDPYVKYYERPKLRFNLTLVTGSKSKEKKKFLQIPSEWYLDKALELQVKNEYDQHLKYINEKAEENVKKYGKILKAFFLETFEKYDGVDVVSISIGHVPKMPFEISKGSFPLATLKKYCEFCQLTDIFFIRDNYGKRFELQFRLKDLKLPDIEHLDW